jgi:hypothetical protein
MFNWKHYHLFKCACKNHTKYKTYTLSTRIVARLVISYSKYNSPAKVVLMYQNMSLNAYRNSFLRVISVIIEIINYPFKLGKMRFKRPFLRIISDPPSIFPPRCTRRVASLEKRPKLRQWRKWDIDICLEQRIFTIHTNKYSSDLLRCCMSVKGSKREIWF